MTVSNLRKWAFVHNQTEIDSCEFGKTIKPNQVDARVEAELKMCIDCG